MSRHTLQPRLRRQRIVGAAHLLANSRRRSVVIDGDLGRDAQNEDADDVRENDGDRRARPDTSRSCRMDVGRLERDVVVARRLAAGAWPVL